MGEDEFDPEFALISEATGNFYPVPKENISSSTGEYFSSLMDVYPPRLEHFPTNMCHFPTPMVQFQYPLTRTIYLPSFKIFPPPHGRFSLSTWNISPPTKTSKTIALPTWNISKPKKNGTISQPHEPIPSHTLTWTIFPLTQMEHSQPQRNISQPQWNIFQPT
jgi:hypothetical protein